MSGNWAQAASSRRVTSSRRERADRVADEIHPMDLEQRGAAEPRLGAQGFERVLMRVSEGGLEVVVAHHV